MTVNTANMIGWAIVSARLDHASSRSQACQKRASQDVSENTLLLGWSLTLIGVITSSPFLHRFTGYQSEQQ